MTERFIVATAKKQGRLVRGIYDTLHAQYGQRYFFAPFSKTINFDTLYVYADQMNNTNSRSWSWCADATDIVHIGRDGKPIKEITERYYAQKMARVFDDEPVWVVRDRVVLSELVPFSGNDESAVRLFADRLNNGSNKRTLWDWKSVDDYRFVKGGPVPKPKARLNSELITRTIRIRHESGDEVVGVLSMYVFNKANDTYAYVMQGGELVILEDDDTVEVL